MRIYLIRHATVNTAPGTCYGLTDVGLIDGWEREGERAISQLPESTRRNAPLYTSPLSRCSRLAALFERDAIEEPRVREMHFGDWEMQLWAALPASLIDLWSNDVANVSPPNGESFQGVSDRVVGFISELVAEHGNNDDAEVIIVTHGGPVRCVAAHVLGLPLANAVRLGYDYAGVACATIVGDYRRLDYWNR